MLGIIMQGPSVLSTLEGNKTQTRMILKTQPPEDFTKVEYVKNGSEVWFSPEYYLKAPELFVSKIPYRAGSELYIKEKVWVNYPFVGAKENSDVLYFDDIENMKSLPEPRPFFDGAQLCKPIGDGDFVWSLTTGGKNYQAMYMPKFASRCHIKIIAARAERLQDICFQDCLKEGFQGIGSYASYIDKLNGVNTWIQNPWVMVYDFEVIWKK